MVLQVEYSRAEILAEIAALPPSVQGTISSYKNIRKNGWFIGSGVISVTLHKSLVAPGNDLWVITQAAEPPAVK